MLVWFMLGLLLCDFVSNDNEHFYLSAIIMYIYKSIFLNGKVSFNNYYSLDLIQVKNMNDNNIC